MLQYSFHTTDDSSIIESKPHDLYKYRVFLGQQSINTLSTSSYWYVKDDTVLTYSGVDTVIDSKQLCVEIIGYTPENRSSTFGRYTDLPYINGCSSKQLINPVRPGDPTWQMLYIPPFTSEQAHHIHSTTRIVLVHSGSGQSHIGAAGKTESFDLKPGTVLVLDKMIPHHFSTQDEPLIVLPLHIYSSTHEEHDHPMFRGTYRI